MRPEIGVVHLKETNSLSVLVFCDRFDHANSFAFWGDCFHDELHVPPCVSRVPPVRPLHYNPQRVACEGGNPPSFEGMQGEKT